MDKRCSKDLGRT